MGSPMTSEKSATAAYWAIAISCGAASWALRWNTYVFLRLLPFASIYIPRIYTSFVLYLGATYLLQRRDRTTRSLPGLCLSWLGGSYHPYRRTAFLFNLVVNSLCLIGCLDFLYRAHWLYDEHDLTFCRTGFVTDTAAKLLCRVRASDTIALEICDPSGTCSNTSAISRDSADDTAVFDLSDLKSNTEYVYTSSHGHRGALHTREMDGQAQSFSLLSTSCMKPNWPYSGVSHPLRIRGLEYLDRYMAEMTTIPSAMLFLGDFIYSDLPQQMAPYTSSYYNKLYRQVYASPSWTRRLRDLPWIHMFDDHEIINDWAPSHPDKTLYPDAIQPFEHYQLSVNPPAAGHSGTMYTAFNIGQVAFFVLDNRSYRSQQPDRPGQGSTAGFGARTMLGLDQLLRLKRWIEQEGGSNGRLLVLVSGVPFTRNWSKGKDEFDSWAGYLNEREEILELLWAQGGAIIISGDRHEHATTLLPPPPNSSHPRNSAVIEFSTSPLSFFHQPWKREYEAHLPTDVPIHVQWEGMSRFGRFDFDTSVGLAVNYTLVVDGEEAWSYTWHKGMDVNSSTSFA